MADEPVPGGLTWTRYVRRTTLPVNAVRVSQSNIEALGTLPGCALRQHPTRDEMTLLVTTAGRQTAWALPGCWLVIDVLGVYEIWDDESFTSVYVPE